MPLEKKVEDLFFKITKKAGVLSLGIASLTSSLGCTDNRHTINLGGVNIKEGITDGEGKESFTDDQTDESVDLLVKGLYLDQFLNPAPNTNILFFDALDFKGYLMDNILFEPQMEIPLHNSDHIYSLTPAPLQALYHDSDQKERSAAGSEKMVSWAEANWQRKGCYAADGLSDLMTAGVYIVKGVSSIFTLGISNDFLDLGKDFLQSKIPRGTVADIYVFIPSAYGFRATSTVWTLVFRKAEDCGFINEENNENNNGDEINNSSNDGHNNDINGNNPFDCKTEGCNDNSCQFYDDFNSFDSECKWNTYQNNPLAINGKLVLDNASAIISKPEINFAELCPNQITIEYTARLQQDAGSYSFYFGNNILIHTDTSNDSLLFGCDGNGKTINVDLNLFHNIKLEKQGNSLSLHLNDSYQGEVACYSQPKYLNPIPGQSKVSILELDKVKVKCD